MAELHQLPALVKDLVVPGYVNLSADDSYSLRMGDIEQIAENVLLVAGVVALAQYLRRRDQAARDSVLEDGLSSIFRNHHQFVLGNSITMLDAWRSACDPATKPQGSEVSRWFERFRGVVNQKRPGKQRIVGEKLARQLFSELLDLLAPLLNGKEWSGKTIAGALEPWVMQRSEKTWLLRKAVHKQDKWELVGYQPALQEFLTISQASIPKTITHWLAELKEQEESGARPAHADNMLKPLLVENYQSLVKLADFLVENTLPETQRALWIKPYLGIKRSSKPIANHDPEGNGGSIGINLSELVLMDCIETSPVEVLIRVANKEPSEELEGYVQRLAASEEESQRIIEESKDWAPSDAGYTESYDHYHKRQLALHVLRLLGFEVCDRKAMRGAAYLRNSMRKLAAGRKQCTRAQDFHGHTVQILTGVVEPFLRDMALFYAALRPGTDLESKSWLSYREALYGGLGIVVRTLKDLNGNEDVLNLLRKRAGFLTTMFDDAAFRAAMREGTPYDLVGVRNWMVHSKEEPFPSARRYDDDFMNELCDEVTACAWELLELFAPERRDHEVEDLYERVYPFKLTFTVHQRHYTGFNRLAYFTETDFDEGIRGTHIHTSDHIDFGHVYFVIPHRAKVRTNLWMEPIMIDAHHLLLP